MRNSSAKGPKLRVLSIEMADNPLPHKTMEPSQPTTVKVQPKESVKTLYHTGPRNPLSWVRDSSIKALDPVQRHSVN